MSGVKALRQLHVAIDRLARFHNPQTNQRQLQFVAQITQMKTSCYSRQDAASMLWISRAELSRCAGRDVSARSKHRGLINGALRAPEPFVYVTTKVVEAFGFASLRNYPLEDEVSWSGRATKLISMMFFASAASSRHDYAVSLEASPLSCGRAPEVFDHNIS